MNAFVRLGPIRESVVRVSVITPVLNRRDYIADCVESVRLQSHTDVEHVVVDGNSSDGTLDVLAEYNHARLYVISGDDFGMYDAINRGLLRADGDVVAVLNSDDAYCDARVLEDVVRVLRRTAADGVYGDRIKFGAGGNRYRAGVQATFEDVARAKKSTFVAHPTVFLASGLARRVGSYDTRYRYAADYDYILRALKLGRLVHVRRPMTFFRIHDESITASGRIRPEALQIAERYQRVEKNGLRGAMRIRLKWTEFFLASAVGTLAVRLGVGARGARRNYWWRKL